MDRHGSRWRLRWLAALALAALAVALAACGGSSSSSSSTDAATSAAPAASDTAASSAAATDATSAAATDATSAASSEAVASGAGKTLGVVVLNERDPDLAKMTEAMKAEAAKVGANINVVDAKGDVATELSQMEDLVTSKPDAIVMMPIDGTASQAAAKVAIKAGIPLFILSTEFAANANVDYKSYIGVDDTEAGRMQADWLNQQLPNGGKIIYIVGTYGASWTDRRKAGFMEKKNANIQIAEEQQANGDRAQAKTLMEDLLGKFGKGEIAAVVAHNDEMAVGAASAIKDAGRQDDIKIVLGVDGAPPGLQAIKDGEETATVLQRSADQGVKAIDVMTNFLAGQPIEKRYDLPFTLVDKSNVDQFLGK